ncbi:MAG: hypothetical protein JNJ59_23075 [Deltaproteobacteria bacterium]|nr:hypothetical protein [Deltaproteobacteria bacterium]
MKKPKPLHLRVMAEYGSSGIWRVSPNPTGPFRHGMLEHASLDLPADLAQAFDDWIERYTLENLAGTLDKTAFNLEGHRLATRLKAFLSSRGHTPHVELQGEAEDGSLLTALVID